MKRAQELGVLIVHREFCSKCGRVWVDEKYDQGMWRSKNEASHVSAVNMELFDSRCCYAVKKEDWSFIRKQDEMVLIWGENMMPSKD